MCCLREHYAPAPKCGPLLSACSRQWFADSLQEFDQPEGTLPSGKNALRYKKRMGKMLTNTTARLGKQPDKIEMLDVGCSCGAKWEYFDISLHGGHISFFNPASLSLLAKHCGFDIASIQTSKVNFTERKDVSPIAYRFSRAAREIMLWPSRWLGKSHDMLAALQKPEWS